MKNYKIQTYVKKEDADKDGIISGTIGDTFYCISRGKSRQFDTNLLVYSYTLTSGNIVSGSGEFFMIDDAINHLNNELNLIFNSRPIEDIQRDFKKEKNIYSMLGVSGN